MNIIFFGSTSDSVIVLEKLFTFNFKPLTLRISAVVTQPPRPIGRKQEITPTPVETWAKEHDVPVLSFPSSEENPSFYANEQTVIDALQPFKADLLVSACYGQRIPIQTITSAKYGGRNVHPSLLPRWRGADPVPWAIMSGDHQTGVTVVTLAEEFDAGVIIAQKKVPIIHGHSGLDGESSSFSDPLRTHLFEIGADLLVTSLPDYLPQFTKFTHVREISESEKDMKKTPYARRFTRQDGFEPWENIQKAFEDAEEAARIDRKFRALMPWPGVWTEIATQARPAMQETQKKRLKILDLGLENEKLVLKTVQLEGKNPISYTQFCQAHTPGVD